MLRRLLTIAVVVMAPLFIGACVATNVPYDARLQDAMRAEEGALGSGQSSNPAGDRLRLIESYSRLIDAGDLDTESRNEALFRRARLYLRQSNCPQALSDVDRAINNGYRSAQAYVLRMSCHRRLGKTEEALHDLEMAIEAAPREPMLYRERATLLMSNERFSEALGDLTRSINLLGADQSSDLHTLRGDAYLAAGQYELAIDDYRAAIRASNRNAMEIMGSAPSRSAQLAPIYEKLSDAYAALAKASARGRTNKSPLSE